MAALPTPEIIKPAARKIEFANYGTGAGTETHPYRVFHCLWAATGAPDDQKVTCGTSLAPSAALNSSARWNPSRRAINTVGNRCSVVL
jgi:hypothetical protein